MLYLIRTRFSFSLGYVCPCHKPEGEASKMWIFDGVIVKWLYWLQQCSAQQKNTVHVLEYICIFEDLNLAADHCTECSNHTGVIVDIKGGNSLQADIQESSYSKCILCQSVCLCFGLCNPSTAQLYFSILSCLCGKHYVFHFSLEGCNHKIWDMSLWDMATENMWVNKRYHTWHSCISHIQQGAVM